jgi:hypothetical protein
VVVKLKYFEGLEALQIRKTSMIKVKTIIAKMILRKSTDSMTSDLP